MNERQMMIIIRILKYKEEGFINIIISLFVLVVFTVLIYANVNLNLNKNSKMEVQDALLTSSQATVVIDINALEQENVHIIEVDKAYERYTKSLKENLKINESGQSENENILKFRIDKLRIYNVYNNKLTKEYVFNVDDGTYVVNNYDSYQYIDGKMITESTIYSEVKFELATPFGSDNVSKKCTQAITYKY